MNDAQVTQSNTHKKRRILKWEKAFITALAQCGVVTRACVVAKIERKTAYRQRSLYEDFAEAWAEALEVAADALELEARRRAIEGVDAPVYQGGIKVGTIRKYSDNLLMFLLKAARPEKFRERHEVVGKDGGPLFKVYLASPEFNPDDA